MVEETGSGVTTLRRGDLVVAPFMWSDGVCDHCREGLTTSCEHGGFWGSVGYDGGQGEAVRVPFADGTLVRLPKKAASDDHLLSSLLTLSDVLGTGHHAALGAGARPGVTVAVVGDGAVGLCAVLAAKRLGAMGVPQAFKELGEDHRPRPSPGPYGHRAPLRRHRHRRRARGRGRRGGPRTHPRTGRARGG